MKCADCGMVAKVSMGARAECDVCGRDLAWQRVMQACLDVRAAHNMPTVEHGYDFRQAADKRFQEASKAYREAVRARERARPAEVNVAQPVGCLEELGKVSRMRVGQCLQCDAVVTPGEMVGRMVHWARHPASGDGCITAIRCMRCGSGDVPVHVGTVLGSLSR